MFTLINVVSTFGTPHDTWNSAAAITLVTFALTVVLAGIVLVIDYLVKHKTSKPVVEQVVATEATQSTYEPETVQEQPTPVVIERVVERPVIVERVIEQPVIVEESVEAGILRYDKSFTARMIQSSDDIKHWYTEIKNKLLSYKTCKSRTSWRYEKFKANKQIVAMLVFRGKKLCLFLPLNPSEYGEEYCVEDESAIPAYAETPAMIRLKNDKRIRIAMNLIAKVMEDRQIELNPKYISADYYLPYEGILELIDKGLIKREIHTSADEAIFER